MIWLGLGLSGTQTASTNGEVAGGSHLALLEPDAAWTGIAGSGFAIIPSDPVRTTAKPACRLLVPPFQHFSSTLDVGVIAVANDGGTLVNAIDRVRFHFEGRIVDVLQARWHYVMDVNGQTRAYWGYWVRLKRPAPKGGKAQLYVEAIPADATMQKRVIGPYLFSPTSAKYDGSLEVAATPAIIPGVRYKTLLSAISYSKGQGWHNPLITITQPGRYDIGDDAFVTAWDQTGYANITASVPGVVIGRETVGNLFSNRVKLHLFGSNITLDRKNVGQLSNGNAENRTHWLDGITITSTAQGGRDELFDGGVRSPINMFGPFGAWLTECTVTDCYGACINAPLVRGCNVFKIGQDVASQALCVVNSTFDDHSNATWNTDIPAFIVQYAGSATATLARSGGTEGSGGGGVYTLTIGGTSYTFDTGNASFGSSSIGVNVGGRTINGWFFADVVAWLNGFAGVTATLLINPDRRANTGSRSGLRGQGFAATDIKTTALTVQSHTDKHGDFYQIEGGVMENSVIAYNRHTNAETQNIFLSPILDGQVRDTFIFGNVMNTTENVAGSFGVAASQIGRPNVVISHVCIVQNSFPDQGWLIRTDGANATMSMDAYCLFKNNIAPSFVYLGGRLTTQMKVENNRFYAGAAQPPGGVDNIIGGSKADLYVNLPAKNFSPTGALLDFGCAPMIPFDMNAAPFPSSAAVGAIAATATHYIAPPTVVSSLITGTPQNGQVLTASYTAAGASPITPTYQWQKDGASIAGETGATIMLNRIGMGLNGGNRISCEITLTNAAGSVTAEPDAIYDAGELSALLAQLSGKSSSGAYDFRQATNTGTWIAANLGGGLGSFTQTTAARQPGISAANGAVFDGVDDILNLTTVAANASLYILLRKDPASDVAGHIIDGVTIYQTGSATVMSWPVGVDGGAVINTRGPLHTALDDGNWHIVSRLGGALTATFPLGRASAGSPKIDVRAVVILNEAEFGGNLAAARSAALTWLDTLR